MECRDVLLKLISNRSGDINWYKIHRKIAFDGIYNDCLSNLTNDLDTLEKEGLIRQEKLEGVIPRLWITAKGKAIAEKIKE